MNPVLNVKLQYNIASVAVNDKVIIVVLEREERHYIPRIVSSCDLTLHIPHDSWHTSVVKTITCQLLNEWLELLAHLHTAGLVLNIWMPHRCIYARDDVFFLEKQPNPCSVGCIHISSLFPTLWLCLLKYMYCIITDKSTLVTSVSCCTGLHVLWQQRQLLSESCQFNLVRSHSALCFLDRMTCYDLPVKEDMETDAILQAAVYSKYHQVSISYIYMFHFIYIWNENLVVLTVNCCLKHCSCFHVCPWQEDQSM